jgi:hypothetical protein
MARKKRKGKRPIILILAIITTLCALALAIKVIPHQIDVLKFRREQAALPKLNPYDAYWLEVNPDYVGWLMVDGSAAINFPVVRGSDNEKYLNTTFSGAQNIQGALKDIFPASFEYDEINGWGIIVHDAPSQIENFYNNSTYRVSIESKAAKYSLDNMQCV